MANLLRFHLCSTYYTALKMENSTRSICAIISVTIENKTLKPWLVTLNQHLCGSGERKGGQAKSMAHVSVRSDVKQ